MKVLILSTENKIYDQKLNVLIAFQHQGTSCIIRSKIIARFTLLQPKIFARSWTNNYKYNTYSSCRIAHPIKILTLYYDTFYDLDDKVCDSNFNLINKSFGDPIITICKQLFGASFFTRCAALNVYVWRNVRKDEISIHHQRRRLLMQVLRSNCLRLNNRTSPTTQ